MKHSFLRFDTQLIDADVFTSVFTSLHSHHLRSYYSHFVLLLPGHHGVQSWPNLDALLLQSELEKLLCAN
jgi:hypothetical protein